jgi:hypothetical protein
MPGLIRSRLRRVEENASSLARFPVASVTMSGLVKVLGIILLGAIGSILGVVLWESSIFKTWHTGNPIDASLNWLGLPISIQRLILIGLVLWSFMSLIYIFVGLRRITIHSASYNSPNVENDVTQVLRGRVEGEGFRRIPVTNEFLGGDPEQLLPKTLTVDYSVWGRRQTRVIGEGGNLVLRRFI